MRRYILYIAVALLAFGIGSFVVFKFYWITEEKPNIAEEQKSIAEIQIEKHFGTGFGIGSSERRLNEPIYIPKLHKATCSDKKLLPIWNELKKDKDFREAAKDFYMQADCTEMLDVQKIDLNDDGQKEIVLWGQNGNLCGATGNCTLWIYENKNGKYKLLLRAGAYNAETRWFEVKKAKSGGYRNLLLKTHFSGYETTYAFYKYNNNKYVKGKCLIYSYFISEDEPSVMTCKEYNEETERQLREQQTLAENQ